MIKDLRSTSSIRRSRLRRVGAAGVAIVLAAGVLAACSDSDGSAGDSSGGSARIGVVANSLADSNQADILRGYEDQGKKYGWTVESTDSQGDAAKANAAIQTYVQQGVDGIAVMVYQAEVLQSGIQAAKASGIPVVLNGANELADGVAAVIPVAAGEAQADALIAGIGTTGDVLMFTFPPGAPCVAQLEDSSAVFDANPGIKTTTHDVPAPGWVVEGQKATATWLQTHPAGGTPLAIWGCWDGPTFGAIAALAAANRTDVKVYGNGGEPEALANVQAGKMAGTIFYDQYTGGGLSGATLLHDAIEAGSDWTPKSVPNPSEVVDSTNIADICSRYPDKCE